MCFSSAQRRNRRLLTADWSRAYAEALQTWQTLVKAGQEKKKRKERKKRRGFFWCVDHPVFSYNMTPLSYGWQQHNPDDKHIPAGCPSFSEHLKTGHPW